MKKEIVAIPGITTPDSPFSHVVRAGGFLFLTSQLSADPKTGELIPGNIMKQTRQALENVKHLLESCGSTMDDIVRVVAFMKDVRDFAKMNRVYKEYFTKGFFYDLFNAGWPDIFSFSVISVNDTTFQLIGNYRTFIDSL